LVQGDYVLVYSRPLLAELLEKLELPRIKEKYGITDNDIADLMALFFLRGDLVNPDRQVTVCRDPEDNMVIEAALAGEARWVVTGDEDLLSLGTYETVSFVTPRAFLERLDEEVSGTSVDEAPDSGDEQ
jgi:putative PIN family toxin of toxin-antitoxin system